MSWFEYRSFLLGFAAASLIWWAYRKYRPQLKKVSKVVTQKSEVAAKQDIKGLDQLIRAEIFRQTQHQHIASRIAALNEIFVEPQLLAYPFMDADLLGDPPIVDQMIPYLPEWNELSGIFDLQGIPLGNLLTSPVNLLLVGNLGAGKSAALAYLTAALVRNKTGLKRLENVLPIMVHINEIDLEANQDISPENALFQSFCRIFPKVLRGRIQHYIHSYYKSNKMIIFIDGLDELDGTSFDIASQFIHKLARKNPYIRIIAGVSPQYLGTLPQQGFSPVVLKGWTDREKNLLTEKWLKIWNLSMITETAAEQTALRAMFKNWIATDQRILTPFDWTLRIWAVLSGDVIDDSLMADIESYFRRLSGGQISHQAVESLAEAFVNQQTTTQTQTNLEMMLIKNRFSLQPDPFNQAVTTNDDTHKNRKKGSAGLDILNKLVEIGFFNIDARENYHFKHPLLLAYFAGYSAIARPPSWEQIRQWPTGTTMHGFSAAFQKEPEWVFRMLQSDPNDLLQKKKFAAARWLKYVGKESNWRNEAFKAMVALLQDESIPNPMRFRALAAILNANDASVQRLFEKLLLAKSHTVRQIAALGCGAFRDKNTAALLEKSTQDSSDIVAYAALAGLGLMHDNAHQRMIRDYLMGAVDETLRRTAAESLAHLPPEGHEILRELSESADIVTRRAVVFGLEVVRQDWSQELLKKLSMEDAEWIVRTTATRILDSQLDASFAIPRPLSHYTSAEWLLKFAASIGEGISPEVAPVDILLEALRSDDADLQWNALNYLRYFNEKEVIRATMKLYFDPKLSLGTARSVDYNLWLFSSGKYN